MFRRKLFASFGPIAALLILANCAGGSGTSVAQIEADVQAVAAGLTTAVQNPAVAKLIPSNQMATVATALTGLQAAAQAIAAASSVSAAQPAVAQAAASVNALLGVLSTLPIPPPYGDYIAAAAVLLPVIEAAAGLPPTPAPAKAAFAGHDSAWARAILSGSH